MSTKICPFCSEEIKATAIKCRYCGSMLSGSGPYSDILSGIELVRQALGERYEVLEEVGRGGMSVVYKAIQRNLKRPVALKVIHQNLLHDEEFVARFHREAQVCASLSHPHIVTVYDEGEAMGVHFMAMEYLEGTDLHELVHARGKLSANQTLQYLLPVAEALDYAHQKGLIHRDIKSSNIFITGSGRVVLMDFGIAHAAGSKMTLEGAVIGTPEYMSPEQADGRKVDHRTDLYSMGVVMYECLTGRVPFSGENAVSTIYKLIHEQPQKEVLGKSPVSLQQLTLGLLSKDPADRPGTGDEVAAAIRQVQQGKRWTPKKQVVDQKGPRPSGSQTKKSRRKVPSVVWFLTLLGVVLVVLLVYQLSSPGEDKDDVAQALVENSGAEVASVEKVDNADEEAWAQARRVSSATSYEKYLELYPRGKYAVEAAGMIAQLQGEERQRQEATKREQEQQEETRRRESEQQARQADRQASQAAADRQQEEEARRADSFLDQMVLVRGGTFTMGCTSEQGRDCDNDEKPAHQVTISSYYIGKFPVTQRQWQQVMGNNPSHFSGCDECPVENVSWNDVQDFIGRLNQRSGKNYRLPTEAEWEYAARGGAQSSQHKYAGSNNLADVAWYRNNSASTTRPVGNKRPNELGLHDMSGNVWEWCHDRYGAFTNVNKENPSGASIGSRRVIKGGSWNDHQERCRLSARGNSRPDNRNLFIGFRLAMGP